MTSAERRELRDDLRDEREEIDADLVGVREEIREARERLAELVARRKDVTARLAELKPPRV